MLRIFVLLALFGLPLAQIICREGYIYNAPTGSCYKFVPYPASWHNALIACRADGGDLISILSVAENNMLDQMALANMGLQKIWIGLFLDRDFKWKWSSRLPVSYKNWYQNYRPANAASCPRTRAPFSTPNIVCANFQPTGYPCNGGGNFWENSIPCTGTLPYVCKQRSCDSNACYNSCVSRGCQSGTCNIGCPNSAMQNNEDLHHPCNPAFALTCTCNFCTKVPCAQPGGADLAIWRKTCPSIGCDSGDCFEGDTICVGCPATMFASPRQASWRFNMAASMQFQTPVIQKCIPNTCHNYCRQHGCRTGGCVLFYAGVADNPCVCDTCLDPHIPYCNGARCNATCTARGFGCHHGNCDQGICNCFICPNNVNTVTGK